MDFLKDLEFLDEFLDEYNEIWAWSIVNTWNEKSKSVLSCFNFAECKIP